MDGDESGVLGLRITRYNKEIGALLLERDGLEAGATPAAQAPTAGAAQPIPSQDKIGEITAGLQRTDLTIQEREYLQQKLQQLQQEQPQGAPAPAGGKGSITMGGKTVTRAGVAPKPGTGSITRAGETATNVPAVKPVAPAAPYVAPITKVQDVLAREPAMPKSLPSKEPTAPPSRQEIEREVAEREYSELDFDNFVNRKIKEAGMTVSDWANAAIQGLYGLGDLANQGALLVGKGTIAATQAPRYTIETAQKMTTAAKNKLSITIENMMRAEEVNNRLAKLTKEAGK